MANYGFIYANLEVTAALEVLGGAAASLFGDRLRVRVSGSQPNLLLVEVPSVHPATADDAKRLWLAQGEPAGFSVEVNPTWEDKPCLAFRSGPKPHWLRWVQGCIEEEISDRLGLPVMYDATGEEKGPGERWYRNGDTFRKHMNARVGSGEALTKGDRAFLKPYFDITPRAFLD